MTLTHPEIAARLFNRPAAITESKARVLLSVVGPRLGIGGLQVAWADRAEIWEAGDMAVIAADAKAEIHRKRREDGRLFHMIEGTGIAVIPVLGTLVQKNGLDPFSGMTGYDGIAAKFRAAIDDAAVRAIAFEIDSPGGEVAGLFDLVDEIHGARGSKPIHAILAEEAYSAAYALASAADRITVPRTGGVGSIGVIALHADYSRALDEAGITVTAIYAGARKNDGTPYAPLTDAAQARIQSDVDATYDIFAATVARNRGVTEASVRGTEAATFRGPDGVAAGLGDAVMSPAEALEALIADIAATRVGAFTATAKKEKTMLSRLSKFGGRNRAAEDDDEDDRETPAAEHDDGEEDDQSAAAEGDGDEDEDAKAKDKNKAEDDGEDEDKAEGDGKDGKSASAFARGRNAERQRIAGILNSDHARGREALARSLALETGLDAATAATVLAASPKQSGGLAAAMANVKNPDVGPDGVAATGEDATVESVAGRIASLAPRRRAHNQ